MYKCVAGHGGSRWEQQQERFTVSRVVTHSNKLCECCARRMRCSDQPGGRSGGNKDEKTGKE